MQRQHFSESKGSGRVDQRTMSVQVSNAREEKRAKKSVEAHDSLAFSDERGEPPEIVAPP